MSEEQEEIVVFGPDDFTEGYRLGYVKGYEAGMADGQMLGFRDAKHRAFKALDDDYIATKTLEAILGEQ